MIFFECIVLTVNDLVVSVYNIQINMKSNTLHRLGSNIKEKNMIFFHTNYTQSIVYKVWNIYDEINDYLIMLKIYSILQTKKSIFEVIIC